MPRCLPAEPTFATVSERDTWLAFQRTLGPDDLLISNLRLTDSRGDHEADLVVVMEGVGIAVIEVKGGSVAHDGRQWVQTGAVQKVIDPVAQARRVKYALRAYLDRDPRWGRRRTRFAHLVAFPYSHVHADFALPDCPRWMVLDRTDLCRDVADLVARALETQETPNPPPTADDLADIAEILGGRMLPQRDLLAEVADRSATVDLLTERQAAILSALRLLPRVEILGGAGSGKTWLAVEQARRLSAEGLRVALMCYSRGLAAFLQRRVEGFPRRHRPAYVGEFHSLGLQWGAPGGSDDDSAYWEEELPAAMVDLAARQPRGQLFDAIVVDEAQDFADSWWAPLLAALGDEDAGRLFVFSDEGQRVFQRQGHAPVSLVPIVLDENLRNTRQIAETFGPLGAFRMRTRGTDGPPVRFVACAAGDALSVADDQVDLLLEEGWAPEHVALLTTGRRHPEQVARQRRGQREYWQTFWDAEQVFYGHVLGFKGLERPVVVLALNGFGSDERAREKLYVGLSRARDLLVVCGDAGDVEAVGGHALLQRLQR